MTAEAAIIEPKLAALAELCRRFHVRRLDLFGSAATGRFDPARSDLDFLVEFEETPAGHSQSKNYFGLLAALEALFGRKVDLVSERTLENPYRRRRIEAERRPLFPVAMISSTSAAFLWDARRAAGQIIRFTTGRNFDDYTADDMLRSAVERQFQIIGEAFAGLRRVDPGLAAQLPELAQAIAFRNVLVHAYTTINDRTVWDAIQNDLPRLQGALGQLLGSKPSP
jgi:uncharacterized protein with HEPN domain/predicted nucleotidyltransferase